MLILISCGALMGAFIGFCLLLPDLIEFFVVIAVAITLVYRLIKKGLLFCYQRIISLLKR